MKKLKNSINLYKKSLNFLAAPSTFSKGIDQFAYGITPYALKKGSGAYVWDVDNNKYIDTIMSLGAIILGHSHPGFNAHILKQLNRATTLSLTSDLEIELSEILTKNIPCAEMVRFGKNGNDATTAAVRLSRYVSKKDHVLFCGYHGWQDWYISKTSMNGGIPADIGKFSHRFNYNDINSLESLLKKYKNQVACIILEPVSKTPPICNTLCKYCSKKCNGFLNKVKYLSKKYKTILIFDEVVTGFRHSIGGYQKTCGVIPDLACFSKAISNGLPLSVLAGKKEIMKKSDEIFYSLTFGGETLSLAAAIYTINFIKKYGVCEKIKENGEYLINEIKNLVYETKMEDIINIQGFSYKNFFTFKDYKNNKSDLIRTYFIQELAKKQVLSAGYHILSFSHNKKIIDKLLKIYKENFKNIKKSIIQNTLVKSINIPKPKLSASYL